LQVMRELAFIVESTGKARAVREVFPEAEVVVTQGSVFDLAWRPFRRRGKRLVLPWREKRLLRLSAGKTYFLATDPDEEGELQASLIRRRFETQGVSFIRVHLFSLDPEEVRERFREDFPFHPELSERLYRAGLARRIYDRLLALYLAKKGLVGFGRSQVGVLHLLAESLYEVRYVHSFFADGRSATIRVFTTDRARIPETLTVHSVKKSTVHTPPLSLARSFARFGRPAHRVFESLYLAGAITYPRVSPRTWNDLPPPITPRRMDLPEDEEERRAFRIVLEASEAREIPVRTLEFEEGPRLFETTPERLSRMPDLAWDFRVVSDFPPIAPGDVLRKAETAPVREKPLWWLLPEMDERMVARPSYLDGVLTKLEKKGLILQENTRMRLTPKGEEVREKAYRAFPELADPDFGKTLMARIREGEGVVRGDPFEPEILDEDFREVATYFLKEVGDENLRLEEPEPTL